MDGTNKSIDFKVSELIVVTIEPVVEAFHAISLNYLTMAEDKCRISFFQAHTIVNNPTEHILVPKHEYVPVDQHAELLKELRVNSKSQLPIIRYHEDMQARVMALIPGDIVKITRPSPSSGVYTVYRVCLPP
jgi:DNA-directed RNA polymerase subunit H (RpoH/RPB5)